jgi:hypothetical protein
MGRVSSRAGAPMQASMTLNVQGAAATPRPDPMLLQAAAPAPPPPEPHPRHDDREQVRRVEAPAQADPDDALRVQAFRRDAAEAAATLGTQAAPRTAVASTAAAPAVKVAPPQVNPLPMLPEAPYRVAEPRTPPAVQAVAAVEEQAGARSG